MKEKHIFQILTLNNISLFPVIKVKVIKVIKDSGRTEYIYSIILNILNLILYYKKRERAESA